MKLFLIISLLICIAPIQNAKAQTITINDHIYFGRFVIEDNDNDHDIRHLFSGGYTADSEYTFFVEPQTGNVTVDGYPPYTLLDVSIVNTDLTKAGSAPYFTTNLVFTNPINVITDASGSATFDVGAKLESDGGGQMHSDGIYDGTFTITVTD